MRCEALRPIVTLLGWRRDARSVLMVSSAPRIRLNGVSRYDLLVRVAAGGMATVYVGRSHDSPALVAIKRTHAHLVEDPDERRRLLREAMLASCVQHPNVVQVREIEELEGEVLLVMDYVEGASLAELSLAAEGRGELIPAAVAARVLLDACAGLEAAHDARDEAGAPLHLVHRDISPQNILVGLDGVARVADFGIAKGGDVTSSTSIGSLKGKLAYMAPEYVAGHPVDARADVFSMGVVLWEALSGDRLFRGANDADTLRRVVEGFVPPLSVTYPELGCFDPVLESALRRSPATRLPTAAALGAALEAAAVAAGGLAGREAVGTLVWELVGEQLGKRRARIAARTMELLDEVAQRPLDSDADDDEDKRKTQLMRQKSSGNAAEDDSATRVQPSRISAMPKKTVRMIVPHAPSRAAPAPASSEAPAHGPSFGPFAAPAPEAAPFALRAARAPTAASRAPALAAAFACLGVLAVLAAVALRAAGAKEELVPLAADTAGTASPPTPDAPATAPDPPATAPDAPATAAAPVEPIATASATSEASAASTTPTASADDKRPAPRPSPRAGGPGRRAPSPPRHPGR